MRSFTLDEDVVRSKATTAENKLGAVMYNLGEAEKVVLEAIEEINKHDELNRIAYGSYETDVNVLNDIIQEYQEIKELVSDYCEQIDDNFFREQEKILEGLSRLKVEDIRVPNNIGIVETKTIIENGETFTYEVKKKDIGFEDILTYGTVSEIMQSQYNEMKKASSEDGQEYGGNINDYIKELIEYGQFDYEVGWKRNLSLTIDLIPIVGDAKGIIECILGKDLITGRELSNLERGLCLLSIIPFVGDGGKIGGRFLKEGIQSAGKLFAKEATVNVVSYMGSSVMQEVGINPLGVLAFYQCGRIGYKNKDAIFDTLKDIDFKNSVIQKKTEFFNVFNSKKANINDYLKSVKEVDGKYVISFKDRTGKVLDIVFRKEELTPYQRYVCFNGCFVEGTLVITEDGYKSIEKIKDGEKVLSKDIESGKIEYKQCKLIEKMASELVVINFEEGVIKTTKDHLFMTDKGWIEACQLNVNESVVTSEETYEKIINIGIESLEEDIPVYNLEIKDYHTFYVGEEGVLVHNEYNMPNLDDIYKSYISEISDEKLKVSFKEQLKRISESNDIELLREFDSKLQNISSGDTKALKELLDNFQVDKGITVSKLLSSYQERLVQTPVNNGKWTGVRGESTFISENIEASNILKEVGKEGIDYSNAIPDFSIVSKGEVKIEGMSTDRRMNFKKADELLAKKLNISTKEVMKMRKINKLTWHELNDMESMQLVPTIINSKFGHLGGVSEVSKINK